MSDLEIVDAHHHFWDPERNYHPWLRDEPMIPFRYGDYSSIRRRFMPEEYAAVTTHFNVVKSVTMEGEWDPTDPIGETRWMQGVAERYGVPNAHVAQAWLHDDNVEVVLREQASFPLVRSVRQKPRSAPRPDMVEEGLPGSLTDKHFKHGYSLLSQFGLDFDLQVTWWHLREAVSLAEEFPETKIILNHTGLPSDRSENGLAGWRRAMKLLAEVPNAYVKISGLGMEGRPWQIEDNRVIILDTIEIFGSDRCMFGSNYPVDSLVGDFDTIIGGFLEVVKDFSLSDQKKLFHDNAMRVYRLF